MSGTLPAKEPSCLNSEAAAIELVIKTRRRDIGGFGVRRLLPASRRRLVGPFIFFDHMGPAQLPVNPGFDVRPHPHIALATLTYLFSGEIRHRDSLGSQQMIRPGDVNWMLAGRGIVHSERSSAESRARGVHIHGIQSWVALPLDQEEVAPRFEHYPVASIPTVQHDAAAIDAIAGSAYGVRSPVGVLSATLYAHVDAEHEERAVYAAEGSIGCGGRSIDAGTALVLRPGARVTIDAAAPARVLLVGGAKLSGERHVFWNFVSSSKQRIEQAKDDWKHGRFPSIPGDDHEFVPLPEG